MAYIYTISHPLTYQVVYVGCTRNIEKRKASYFRQKKILRPIDQYILDLREGYLYPKIEVIHECNDDNSFEEEMFWIRMMKTWGFDLLNVNKLNPTKQKLYSDNKFAYTGEAKVRKSRKWDVKDFYEGNVMYLNGAKKSIFTVTFKAYCRRFGVNFFLKYSECNSYVTLLSEKPARKVRVKKGRWPSGEDRKQVNSEARNNMIALREPLGRSVFIGYKDSKSLAAIISYHLRDIPKKRMNYKTREDGAIEVLRIY